MLFQWKDSERRKVHCAHLLARDHPKACFTYMHAIQLHLIEVHILEVGCQSIGHFILVDTISCYINIGFKLRMCGALVHVQCACGTSFARWLACLWINYYQQHQFSRNKWYIDWHFNENRSLSACHAIRSLMHVNQPMWTETARTVQFSLHSIRCIAHVNRFYNPICENEKILFYTQWFVQRFMCDFYLWNKMEKEVMQVPTCQGQIIYITHRCALYIVVCVKLHQQISHQINRLLCQSMRMLNAIPIIYWMHLFVTLEM